MHFEVKINNQPLCAKLVFSRLVLLLPLFFFHPSLSAQAQLVLNVTGQPPLNTPELDGFMDDVSREALRRIGYKLVINHLPAERALRSANTGLIDGEMSRIAGLEKTYANLIRVPEKIIDWEFVVFSKNKIDLQYGWDSLKDKKVAFITGWKIIEKNVPETALITRTKNAQQLFILLEKDRVDLIIYERWGGKYLIKNLHLDKISLQLPRLEKKEMFIYLNKKHVALVPELSRALTEMKTDGSYQELVKKHLTSLLEKI